MGSGSDTSKDIALQSCQNLQMFVWCEARLCPPLHDPYDPTTATSMKKSLKNKLRILSNHFAIIPDPSY